MTKLQLDQEGQTIFPADNCVLPAIGLIKFTIAIRGNKVFTPGIRDYNKILDRTFFSIFTCIANTLLTHRIIVILVNYNEECYKQSIKFLQF